tara:strand:- start:9972 stop:10208 length:237 start_codon:yes stop_codon:yes gene_type:complete
MEIKKLKEETVLAVFEESKKQNIDDKHVLLAVWRWDTQAANGKKAMWHGEVSEEVSDKMDVDNIVASAKILQNLSKMI